MVITTTEVKDTWNKCLECSTGKLILGQCSTDKTTACPAEK
jgi:hypothetical protein